MFTVALLSETEPDGSGFYAMRFRRVAVRLDRSKFTFQVGSLSIRFWFEIYVEFYFELTR